MNSIGKKIRLALIGSITTLAIVALIMLSVVQIEVFQSQQIIKTMTMEYSIIPLSEDLIKNYNDVVKNPNNNQFSLAYDSVHSQIKNTIFILQKQITRSESKILMTGVENTVNLVINECDAGLEEIKNNNFGSLSDHFSEAHKNNSFVVDNVRTLLQKELE
jgi:hypothetical protein